MRYAHAITVATGRACSGTGCVGTGAYVGGWGMDGVGHGAVSVPSATAPEEGQDVGDGGSSRPQSSQSTGPGSSSNSVSPPPAMMSTAHVTTANRFTFRDILLLTASAGDSVGASRRDSVDVEHGSTTRRPSSHVLDPSGNRPTKTFVSLSIRP